MLREFFTIIFLVFRLILISLSAKINSYPSIDAKILLLPIFWILVLWEIQEIDFCKYCERSIPFWQSSTFLDVPQNGCWQKYPKILSLTIISLLFPWIFTNKRVSERSDKAYKMLLFLMLDDEIKRRIKPEIYRP